MKVRTIKKRTLSYAFKHVQEYLRDDRKYAKLAAKYEAEYAIRNFKPVDMDHPPAPLSEIQEGIFGARVAMHHREIFAAADAKDKYLGKDVLAENMRAEYESLPQAEKDRMKAARNYGKYGVFDLATRDEVSQGLAVVGFEIAGKSGEDSLADFARHARREILELLDPAPAKLVMARFPTITMVRIQNALAIAGV